MGLAKGIRPQDLAEKRPRPQKMQGEMSTDFLMVTWNGRCQESGAKALTLKMSFSRAAGKVRRQERRGLVT